MEKVLIFVSYNIQYVLQNISIQLFLECMINTVVDHGNITCENVSPGIYGDIYVESGARCTLECQTGFVRFDQNQATCVRGEWSTRLECVRPGM